MSRATAKAGVEIMTAFRTNLPFRCLWVVLLAGSALLFGGAVFSPGGGMPTLNPWVPHVGEMPEGDAASRDPAAAFQDSAVLRRLEEYLLTQSAVSRSV